MRPLVGRPTLRTTTTYRTARIVTNTEKETTIYRGRDRHDGSGGMGTYTVFPAALTRERPAVVPQARSIEADNQRLILAVLCVGNTIGGLLLALAQVLS